MNNAVQMTIIGLAVVGLVAVVVLYTLDGGGNNPRGNQEADASSSVPVEAIVAKHHYENHVHTYVGNVVLASPCHQLWVRTNNATTPESEEVTFVFETKETADTCLDQEPTSQKFLISFLGAEEVSPSVRFNGQEIALDSTDVATKDELTRE